MGEYDGGWLGGWVGKILGMKVWRSVRVNETKIKNLVNE